MDKKRPIIKILEYLVLVVVIAVVAFIYVNVAKNIKDLWMLNNQKNYDAIKEYIRGFGKKGAIIIAMLEMVQMVVVVIPAEFVQVSAGLAYPVYIALPICMTGVFLGSTVIFILTRGFKLRLSLLEKKTNKISDIIKKVNSKTPMTVIMYILFIMPLIPFGAIAYFASSSNINYKRYAFVCTTGVIPSILSSYILGNVMIRFLGQGKLQFFIAVVVVIILMVILLLTLANIIKKIFFVKQIEKPNIIFYYFAKLIATIIFSTKVKVKCNKTFEGKIKKPSIVLCNHGSFYDFYYLAKIMKGAKLNYVVNRYYFDNRKTKPIMKLMQAIPKKLFTNDMETIKQLYQAKKNNLVIAMMPEGRLSSSGQTFPVPKATSKLLKKLGVDIYFAHISGGYAISPKWRGGLEKGKVQITLSHLFTAESVAKASVKDIDSEINKYLDLPNEMTAEVNVKGLDGVLYECPNCNSCYSLTTDKTSIKCGKCGRVYNFSKGYKIDDDKITSIIDWYNYQAEELKSLVDRQFKESVLVKGMDYHKGVMHEVGSGECVLNSQGIQFNGIINGEKIEHIVSVKDMQALAFSCNEEFEFYIGQDLYYFYPKNGAVVSTWSQYWDVLTSLGEEKC